VFQIIQYCFCPLTHVFTSSLALSLPFRLMDTSRERLAQIAGARTIWIVDARRDDGKRFVVRGDEKLTAFVVIWNQRFDSLTHLPHPREKADVSIFIAIY
jgi:hypothetical protein